jgi:signal transduction histidine kinase
MSRLYLALFFLLCCKNNFAQVNWLKDSLAKIENSNAHITDIVLLNNLLKNKNLSNEDRLAIQTTLVHKFQHTEKWDTCLQYCESQIIDAKKEGNDFAEASFYKMLANTNYHLREKQKALYYWNKCIEISLPKNYSVLLEQCNHNIAAYYIDYAVRYDSAEICLLNAIEIGKKNHDEFHVEHIGHYRLLATTYERTNQLNKADELYKRLIVKCRKLKDTSSLTEILMFYSDVLVKKKDFIKAIEISGEALNISKAAKQLDVTVTALAFHTRNLTQAGRYKEAYDLKQEENYLLADRFKTDLNTKISTAEATFKNAEVKHEKEVAILKAKKKTQIYLFSFIGLLFATGFGFYYVYQKRNAQQKAQLQQARVQSILDGEEKERTRIAKDLHDGIVQDLTAIKLQLNAGINNNDNTVEKNIVVSAVDSIDKASKEVRNISYQMMPATLIQLGFIPAIEDLLKRVLTPSNIQYDFEQIGVTERLPDNIEVSIFRITQELLNNVLKHSEANFVSLLITLKANVVTMIFEDNGKGFDASTVKKGIGFSSLSSRVELLNGDIKYEKGNGVGTMAIVKIPISN